MLKKHKNNNHNNQVYVQSSMIISEILDSLSKEKQSIITIENDPVNDRNSGQDNEPHVDDLDLENSNSNTVENEGYFEM